MIVSRIMNLTGRFFHRLPVRYVAADEQLDLLNREERNRLHRIQWKMMSLAAIFSIIGFLSYYLPLYNYPHLFPAARVTLPLVNATVNIPWSSLTWGVALTVLELWALVLLNIASVHEIAVATGFINAENKTEKSELLLRIGLERKATEVTQYGIDPFQGLNKWALFFFNLVLRLKGWLGNQVIRYLMRLFLGRYAVRAALDFAGMPLYMAINAYSVYAVMRQARVIVMGQTIIARLMKRLPDAELSPEEKELLYDTLQYIAISKRDFHQNHYLMTKELLDHFRIPPKERLLSVEDYLDGLRSAPAAIRSLCRLIILVGYVLDGQLSWRERLKLRRLNQTGVLEETDREVKRYLHDFIDGAGISDWSEEYISRIEESSQNVEGKVR
ncbi:MAG: hypothetical protein AB1631_28185 [Acidobacteriota bacterium]